MYAPWASRPFSLCLKKRPYDYFKGFYGDTAVVKQDGMNHVAAFFEQQDKGSVRKARATGSLWNTLV